MSPRDTTAPEELPGPESPRRAPPPAPYSPCVRHVPHPDIDAALREAHIAAANPHGLSISIGHSVLVVGGPERLALPFQPRGWCVAGTGLPRALQNAVPQELAARGVTLQEWREAVWSLQVRVKRG